MLTRRTVILAGLEGTTYAVAATATAPLLAWDVELDIKGEVLQRDILRDTLSPAPHVIGMKEVGLSFKTEIKASASAGTAPEISALLSACGFGTSVITGTGARTYTLKSNEADIKSASLWVYKDGNRHEIRGARGNVRFIFEAGKYGVCEWELSGLYGTVFAVALPDLAGAETALPPICYAANFQIGGFSPVTTRAQIDLGNTIARRDSLNEAYGVKGFRITKREGKLEFDADAVVESSNPFWGDWAGEIVDTFNVKIGTAAGNTIKVNGIFEYESNKYGDQDGVSKYDCKAALVSSDVNTQNDELVITFS